MTWYMRWNGQNEEEIDNWLIQNKSYAIIGESEKNQLSLGNTYSGGSQTIKKGQYLAFLGFYNVDIETGDRFPYPSIIPASKWKQTKGDKRILQQFIEQDLELLKERRSYRIYYNKEIE